MKHHIRKLFKRILLALMLSCNIFAISNPSLAERSGQGGTPVLQAQTLMDRMTPKQKIGQLFVVTFDGETLESSPKFRQLIEDYHIGGVLLSVKNNNFSEPENTILNLFRLTTQIQQAAWDSSLLAHSESRSGTTYYPQYIPLFIGVSQEGDGVGYDQIINGVTSLPNQMAIGATWNPDYAMMTGNILGKELSKVGINLILGPSMDVLDNLNLEVGEDLGTRTFGSDPFWVGEMGKYYIKGIHQGSANQIAVIAKHFPGRGGSDRPPEEEVATVKKSLEQLKQIELAPFFSITENISDSEMKANGLLVSHIRYQGFQGNIRATTRPVSFDPSALQLLLDLPQFTSWRSGGGIIMSDNLGSQAVRKFYESQGIAFDGKQIARSAFISGSDLLFLDDFTSPNDEDPFGTIRQTLEFFEQKYREDPAFAQRVDESVLRLLSLKFGLYEQFSLDTILPTEEGLVNIGKSQQVVFEIARNSVTLLSPDQTELFSNIPDPPQTRDRIVFLTNVEVGRQCSTCPEQATLAIDSLQKAVVKLYGPQSGEQVTQYRLASYSFRDLNNLLNNIPDIPPIGEDLKVADWIVFVPTKMDRANPESLALKRLLTERPDLITNKRVLVFAFNAPYYLDATDISKISGYYGFYSKVSPFVDVAARVLFQELTPQGASPVSIPGIGYDLNFSTSPDPKQVIQLSLNLEEINLSGSETPVFARTPPAPSQVKFKVGDSIPFITGKILDHNANNVPDGTVVRFIISTGGDNVITQQIETVTTGGVAKGSYRIASSGFLEIKVISEPALISEIIQLDITGNEAVAITSIAPTSSVTEMPEPTISQEAVTPEPIRTDQEMGTAPTIGNWLLSAILVWVISAGIYLKMRPDFGLRWSVRFSLSAAIGGLIFFIVLASGFLSGFIWKGIEGVLKQTFIALAGMGFGWIACYLGWRSGRKPNDNS